MLLSVWKIFSSNMNFEISAALDPFSGPADVNNNYPGEYWGIFKREFRCSFSVSFPFS
jgi:hypothetical protein